MKIFDFHAKLAQQMQKQEPARLLHELSAIDNEGNLSVK